MSKAKLDELRSRVDGATTLDSGLLNEVAEALGPVFPEARTQLAERDDTTEAVLELVDCCLPGWTISLHGQASQADGHWRCTLRESPERDNDMVIGTGEAPKVSLALLEALLKVASIRASA